MTAITEAKTADEQTTGEDLVSLAKTKIMRVQAQAQEDAKTGMARNRKGAQALAEDCSEHLDRLQTEGVTALLPFARAGCSFNADRAVGLAYCDSVASPYWPGYLIGAVTRTLRMRLAEGVRVGDLGRVLAMIGKYNHFDPEKVAEAARTHLTPGAWTVVVGREGSPVLYLQRAWGLEAPDLPDEQREEEARAFARAAWTQEFDRAKVIPGWRLWWD